ncbi:MAG TPA: hypothetical protein VK921_16830 [Anditalea sp.]|nr:hypothetical protein [Anditalea sp.]
MQDVTKKKEVETFLKDFKEKKKIWGVLFLGRDKNFKTLALLELRPVDREGVLDNLTIEDYSQGPIPEDWYGSKEMWVFGKVLKGHEIYIKITLGAEGSNTICISFHTADHPMLYPLKHKSQ